jgi:hypothetical protein
MSAAEWSTANQGVLIAEFARLRALLAGEDTAPASAAAEQARALLESPAAIDVLAEAFNLSPFERDVLLLCVGAEMDGALAARCAGPESPQACVTFALALAKLPDPHWSALAPVRPLRRWRLLEVRDERALTSSRLSVEERVLHFLAGVNYLDARLRALFRMREPMTILAGSHVRIAASAAEAIGNGNAQVVMLSGTDGTSQAEVACHAAHQLGLQLHELPAADIPANAHEADALAALWYRESVLLHSALLISDADRPASDIDGFLQRLDGIVFVGSREPLAHDGGAVRFRVDRPAAIEQKQLWVDALGASAAPLNGALDRVAAQFRLSADAIARTASGLKTAAPANLPMALWEACRDASRIRLGDLAQRIESMATWNDLVLPEPQLATLRQVAAHVRQRLTVYDHWGFAGRGARGLGISVLFTGESGTGKTMAAEVLGNELHLDVYRIDLASMVSKYIGETEKNLRRVFDAAENSGAILLFDEADALFGKRSDVNDSHDRYANIEVSYLLQRMEVYRGLAILTTNLKSSLDSAFQRRLRFIVHFPFPDAQLRERIWRGVFPANVPLDAVDHRKLAQLNVAGGNIHNIALNAAFLAADERASVGMHHLLQAARSEAGKRERPFSDAETRGWA